MATLQLLARLDRGGEQEVAVVDNPGALAPAKVKPSGGRSPALLGSSDVLRLAWRLCREEGYRATSVTLADHTMTKADDPFSNVLADRLVVLLREGADWQDLEATIDAGGVYVFSVELRDPAVGGRVQILQQGIITTDSVAQVEKLASVIRGRFLG